MARRLLSSRARADLFGVPTDYEALVRRYLLSGDRSEERRVGKECRSR